MSADKELRKGKVKFYIDEKLFGFLNDLETDREIYIPVAGLIDEIRKNDIVSYREVDGTNGPEAIDVKITKL
ncbi:cold shock domain-containing protein [Cryomorpha ignava]|uniref:Cold shock domain-containing protein n=1 Tax=Cryomorpha ignava TaxID=101383 RepID=A0A7K3WRP0_9FLAO|nr:cold shock domain-containing protein [Cryomorpha ignava]NEN24186.1 cold shock domain-containing protein [Cryomorpha ignava]